MVQKLGDVALLTEVLLGPISLIFSSIDFFARLPPSAHTSSLETRSDPSKSCRRLPKVSLTSFTFIHLESIGSTGIPLVASEWLLESASANSWLDHSKFLVKDFTGSTKDGISCLYQAALFFFVTVHSALLVSKLFDGKLVFIGTRTKMARAGLEDLITSTGGKVCRLCLCFEMDFILLCIYPVLGGPHGRVE